MLPWAHRSQHPKWHLDWYSLFCAAHGRRSVLYSWLPILPLKIALLHGDLDPSLGPTQVYIPNDIKSIGSAIFAELTIMTDRLINRQTDRQTNTQTTLLSL